MANHQCSQSIGFLLGRKVKLLHVLLRADGTLVPVEKGRGAEPPPEDEWWRSDVVEDRFGLTRAVADSMRGMSQSPIALGQLHTIEPHWVWLYCINHSANCHHSRPVAVAPYVIRWPSDIRARDPGGCGGMRSNQNQ